MDAFYKKHKTIAWAIGLITVVGVFYQYVYKSGLLSTITNGMFGTSASDDADAASAAAQQQQTSDDSAFSSFLQSLTGSASGSSSSSSSGSSSGAASSSSSSSNDSSSTTSPLLPVNVGNTTPVSMPAPVNTISVASVAAALQQNAASMPSNSGAGIILNSPGNALGGGTVYAGGQSASWSAG